MGRITTDQSHQIMAALATNADWSAIDFEKHDLQDRIIRNASEAGRLFTEWLKSGGSMIQPQAKLLQAEKPKLLEFVTTIMVSAYERFEAEKVFAGDTSKKAKVKIAWTSDNFKRLFGSKVEKNILATDVRLDKMLKSSLDAPIIAELGGVEKCTIPLAHFYDTLAWKQANNDLTWVIAYVVSDVDQATWAVRALWHLGNDGWYVSAYSTANPPRWDDGRQVVSR